MKKLYSLAVLLLLSVLITSCSKKNDNPVSTVNQADPTIPKVLFNGPVTASNDFYAKVTATSIESFNSLPKYFVTAFDSLPPVKEENTWKWTHSPVNGFIENLTAVRNSEGGFNWTLIQDGTIDIYTYSNWKALDGVTSADGKNGSWKEYWDNTALLLLEFSWTTDASGVLSGTEKFYDKDGITMGGKTIVVNRPDKSGEFRQYGKNEVLTWSASWNSNGSGTWTAYQNGQESASGSWQ